DCLPIGWADMPVVRIAELRRPKRRRGKARRRTVHLGLGAIDASITTPADIRVTVGVEIRVLNRFPVVLIASPTVVERGRRRCPWALPHGVKTYTFRTPTPHLVSRVTAEIILLIRVEVGERNRKSLVEGRHYAIRRVRELRRP